MGCLGEFRGFALAFLWGVSRFWLWDSVLLVYYLVVCFLLLLWLNCLLRLGFDLGGVLGFGVLLIACYWFADCALTVWCLMGIFDWGGLLVVLLAEFLFVFII